MTLKREVRILSKEELLFSLSTCNTLMQQKVMGCLKTSQHPVSRLISRNIILIHWMNMLFPTYSGYSKRFVITRWRLSIHAYNPLLTMAAIAAVVIKDSTF